MNICSLTGRVTTDLERKVTPSNVTVCSFTLAVKRPRTKDTTDFVPCVAFRQTADYLATYGQKGVLIEVSGVLTSRNWEDKNGNKRTSYEIIVDNASILESKKTNVNIERTKEEAFAGIDDDIDLPFD